jgi:hypothetical protein
MTINAMHTALNKVACSSKYQKPKGGLLIEVPKTYQRNQHRANAGPGCIGHAQIEPP